MRSVKSNIRVHGIRLIVLICFSFFSPNLKAQEKTISIETDSVLYLLDSSTDKKISSAQRLSLLEKAFENTLKLHNDSLKTKYLGRLSLSVLQTKDSLLFRKINQEIIPLAKKERDSIVLAEAYWDLATFFGKYAIKDSTYYSYSEAQKIFEAKKDTFSSGRMLYNMARTQAEIKDYVGSETTTIRAIEKFKLLNKNKKLYDSYNSLGITSNSLGEHERALGYYNEAMYYLEKIGNPKLLVLQNINNVGIVYRDRGEYQKAIAKFEEVTNTDSIKLKYPRLYAKALSSLALCKIRTLDSVGVNSLLEESIKIKDSLNEIGSLAASYFGLAEYYLIKSDTNSSKKAANKAILLSKRSSNYERQLKTLDFLIKIDKANASKYAQNYIRLNDSLQNAERKIRNKFARIRFETDEFIAENVQLEEQKATLSKEKKMWIAIALIFLLLGTAVYVIINQRARNQKLIFLQKQQTSNQEIFDLMLAQKQKVDEGKRMEQKRISEELHDGVLGKMLGARMVLTGLNKRADEESIKERSEAISALKNVENEVRSISHELSHSAYQKIGNFVNSIETLLKNAQQNVNIKTHFSYDQEEDWDALRGDLKINVYRIIQETLQNAIKHADCDNFFINFERDETTIHVTMSDDGKGFKTERGKKGIGMRNISSRVTKLNGTWSIDGAPGKGTKTVLKIPIQLSTIVEDDTKQQLQDV
ncbi:tetratricopeptide repeat protein [Maribacter sp. 2210JD10-5]|uniref:tetratricopeptide repeat-containing sensor histidine kinase n=1 Tax=Maribacter sp. 2210JD10-5 TaxID=3386272 RepID=UPI0039BD63C2